MAKRSRAKQPAARPASPAARAFWTVFQWLLIPGALFAVGYSFIGPRIGQVPALKAGAEKVTKIVASTGETPAQQPAAQKPANRPVISITVEPSDGRRRRTREDAEETERRAERPARTLAPQPAESSPDVPEEDPASGAGAIPEAPAETPPTREEDPAGGTGGGSEPID